MTVEAIIGIGCIVSGLLFIISALVDLEYERRRKRESERLSIEYVPFPAPPVWIVPPVIRHLPLHPMPLDAREREQMIRMQNEMIRNAMQSFQFGSQALRASERCDICGARIIQRHHDMTVLFYNPAKDSKRCQGACGWQKSEEQQNADRLEGRNEGQLSLPPRSPPPLSAI